ncbi:MAG: alkyl hydroperoxide reductase subunit F [Propionibacteriaceae bacterium]|jgi:alkyl hydroperoxide reductase subunit F|nr:alkyl hydroperoxide reductase subunit F [Propionibacteriaceae bacterium]
MLDPALLAQLKGYLELLRNPVEIVATLDDSPASRQTGELIADITSVSPQVSSRVVDAAAGVRTPSFQITRPGQDTGVRFAGLPLGHEFTSLVLALLHVGGHPPKEEPALLDQAKALAGPLHFETFFSLTCQNCPDVVQALNLLAALNPGVTHMAIEGGVNAAEAAERGVMSVPTIFLNGELFGQGRMSLSQILGKLDASTGEVEAAAFNAREPYDVLVVGGGPAGFTAALYAARKQLRTGLVAERLGGQVMETSSVENFITHPKLEGPALASALEAHVRTQPVEIMPSQRAVSLRRGAQWLEVAFAHGGVLRARSVILATGAKWRDLGIPGELEYRNKGVTYCPHCDGPLFAGKSIAVVGGGNSAVEAAIDLAQVAAQVTLLARSEVSADEVLQSRLASLPNAQVLTGTAPVEIRGDETKVTGVRVERRADGAAAELALDGVFVQIGLVPGTAWLQGAVDLTERGEIIVDARQATSLPGVFAAGDCTTVPFKQIVIAAGEGAKAALSAFDYLIRQ